jgi:hypothetical protein
VYAKIATIIFLAALSKPHPTKSQQFKQWLQTRKCENDTSNNQEPNLQSHVAHVYTTKNIFLAACEVADAT